MSPTVFRVKGFRFFFFSREEERMHVHVSSSRGEAKFWIEPEVSLANNWGLTTKEMGIIREIIEERKDEISSSWKKHFRC
jgi:hypothetical protein